MKQYLIFLGVIILTGIGVFLYTKHLYKVTIPKAVSVAIPYQAPKAVKGKDRVTRDEFTAIEMQKELYKRELDSIKRNVGIKPGSISMVSDIATKADLSLSGDTVHVHDTLYQFSSSPLLPYYNIKGVISPHHWDVDLQIYDTLHTIMYTKHHLFSPNETILNIANSNPYVKVIGGKVIIIKQKRPLFTIGPYIGYEIYPNNHFSVGISVQYPLITIK